ncbi:hypothetical protein [Streptomyces sp. NPDC004008]
MTKKGVVLVDASPFLGGRLLAAIEEQPRRSARLIHGRSSYEGSPFPVGGHLRGGAALLVRFRRRVLRVSAGALRPPC